PSRHTFFGFEVEQEEGDLFDRAGRGVKRCRERRDHRPDPQLTDREGRLRAHRRLPGPPIPSRDADRCRWAAAARLAPRTLPAEIAVKSASCSRCAAWGRSNPCPSTVHTGRRVSEKWWPRNSTKRLKYGLW